MKWHTTSQFCPVYPVLQAEAIQIKDKVYKIGTVLKYVENLDLNKIHTPRQKKWKQTTYTLNIFKQKNVLCWFSTGILHG